MKIKNSLLFILIAGFSIGLSTVSAHVSVSADRTLGSIDNTTATNNVRTVSSSYGWADATDANWGDSHRTTAFKFTLSTVQTVSITVARRDAGSGQTGAAGTLLPAFSLYQTPLFRASTHDTGPATTAYLTTTFGNSATGESFTDANSNSVWNVGETFTDANGNNVYDGPGIGGSGKEGAFRALDPWVVYVDAVNGLPMYFNTLIGQAADGTSANYGTASGINGDGNADGTVTSAFTDLLPGDYYLFVGGADYSAQNTEAPIYGPTFNAYPTYGISLTVTAVPEPSTSALLFVAAGGWALLRRKRNISV